MSKRPTIVKPATEGAKKIVIKQWNENNTGADKYEIDSIEQVMPCASMLMEFENTRAEMEKQIGSKNLESANLWLSPPQEYFDRIINEGCDKTLTLFNAFFSRDVHTAIRDGYHPYRVILCRVLLGRVGREYEAKNNKIHIKKICAIPSFIVTFTACIAEVMAKSSQKVEDKVYEELSRHGSDRVSRENLLFDEVEETVSSKPASTTVSQGTTPQKTIKLEGQKFCNNCGELCPGGSKFCPSCGTKF